MRWRFVMTLTPKLAKRLDLRKIIARLREEGYDVRGGGRRDWVEGVICE